MLYEVLGDFYKVCCMYYFLIFKNVFGFVFHCYIRNSNTTYLILVISPM